ncbi:hypothetical protein C479_10910 [Halovivax asiaticus JCM 14624]|uniref:Uncharacterized protein n=1 Tax=Halovivax asiaticus JCM 14624 TaxID=1227490 RepID=M0BEK4_9EURY|nr:DUF5810 domain-containing protein [Halovivax asiaticus]ELZ09326.1 hypothetical protein C479_10910 [Halovivax asiaticus JCM 14624]
MGYACPVCGAEQADGVHLANHLAVTASLGRSDHEAWLAEYAPDWRDDSPDELADRITPHATEIETPAFETDDGSRPQTGFEHELAAQTRGPGRGSHTTTTAGHGTGADPLTDTTTRSADVESVLAEAHELTEEMRAGADDERDGTEDSDGHEEAADGPTPTDGDENA